jgi:protein-arginine kinase activator protein McsA
MARKRRCTKCEQKKATTEFYVSKSGPAGLHSWCKECFKSHMRSSYRQNSAKFKQRAVAWQLRHPDRYRHSRLASKRGVPREQVAALEAKADGRCAICRRAVAKLQLDHCHRSGQVRDFLCGRCNRGLGAFGDDMALLQAAVAYLERHTTAAPPRSSSTSADC